MNILYSFNKRGFEADYWYREIKEASDEDYNFFPFNHDPYLDTSRYIRAQLLDNLYHDRNAQLMHLYDDFECAIKACHADAVIVDNCNPYHPDYLKKNISTYKVLRIADGPISAYDRDFAYLHAFDHILYHSPAYSRDMSMVEKLEYCGVERFDIWPLASFGALCDPSKTENDIMATRRDIDVIFIGAMHINKMPLFALLKKALGRRFHLYGLTSIKRNIYFNVKYGFPKWVRPVDFREYVPLYQRSRIGINIHNRGDYTVGSYRLFDLPANGVMQISDGGPYLEHFFAMEKEIVSYRTADELIDKIRYYLEHDDERNEIALNGYRRVEREHRLKCRMREVGDLIMRGAKSIRNA